MLNSIIGNYLEFIAQTDLEFVDFCQRQSLKLGILLIERINYGCRTNADYESRKSQLLEIGCVLLNESEVGGRNISLWQSEALKYQDKPIYLELIAPKIGKNYQNQIINLAYSTKDFENTDWLELKQKYQELKILGLNNFLNPYVEIDLHSKKAVKIHLNSTLEFLKLEDKFTLIILKKPLNCNNKDYTFYQNLLFAVASYIEAFPSPEAQEVSDLLIKQISQSQDLRDRKNFEAHLSSKTFIFNVDFSKVLLLHHKGLNRWLQPGGHTDPEDNSMVEGAMREGIEETGITNLIYYPMNVQNPEVPFNLDIHSIPANLKKNEPAHLHYGFGYVFVAPSEDLSIDLTESNDAKWISFEEFEQMEKYQIITRKVKDRLKNANIYNPQQ